MKLEETNFRIDSSGWEACVIGGVTVLINPLRDVIELRKIGSAGEQHFRWSAAVRETAKARKRMPSDEEWGAILGEIHSPHLAYETLGLPLAGLWVELPPEWPDKSPKLTFGDVGQMGVYWSGTQAQAVGHAWRRGFSKGRTSATRYASVMDAYLSVRCMSEEDREWTTPYRECEIILPK
ncbi:MAG: hypothetical protein QMC36_00510 [Patescibacteria group bacterium]